MSAVDLHPSPKALRVRPRAGTGALSGILLSACCMAAVPGVAAPAAAPVFEATPVREAGGEPAPLLAPPGAVEAGDDQAPAEDPLVSDARGVGQDGEQDAAPADGSARSATARVGDASFRAPRFADEAGRGTGSGDVEADAAGVLFARLQDMQREVMMLRGVVESQQQAIQRLEREQRERYLDLDRRLARITGTEPAGETGSADPDRAAGQAGDAGDERSAYERAFALTRDRRFDEAIPAFRELIDRYPDGQYVPNAWYWLGELYLALPEADLEEARQAFVQVERQFPGHRKAPDALYKLGVVHDRLGETEQARSYLNRVLEEHPDSSAARLAANQLEQLGD